MNFNINIVIFWNHLWVKVAVFSHPVPFRAWLQTIYILKKGLFCDPAMWIISRKRFWHRKPPPPFLLTAIMCEGFRTLSPVLFFSSRHFLFVIFVPGPRDTQEIYFGMIWKQRSQNIVHAHQSSSSFLALALSSSIFVFSSASLRAKFSWNSALHLVDSGTYSELPNYIIFVI